jgi:hypothetical protein
MLKILQNDFKITLLCLCQLSRAIDGHLGWKRAIVCLNVRFRQFSPKFNQFLTLKVPKLFKLVKITLQCLFQRSRVINSYLEWNKGSHMPECAIWGMIWWIFFTFRPNSTLFSLLIFPYSQQFVYKLLPYVCYNYLE